MSHNFAAGHAQVMAAERIAEALVVGFDLAMGEGRALTQLQQTDMVRSALIAFDGYRKELQASLEIDKGLELAFAREGRAA